jgi:hypothetical protein
MTRTEGHIAITEMKKGGSNDQCQALSCQENIHLFVITTISHAAFRPQAVDELVRVLGIVMEDGKLLNFGARCEIRNDRDG